MIKRVIPIIIILVAITALVIAQDNVSDRAQGIVPVPNVEVDPNINISWPPPVYVLRGQTNLEGTVKPPNLLNYFLEFRPLVFDTEESTQGNTQEGAWFPISLPSSTSVDEGVLATWNTATTADGLYEIRMVVNIRNQSPVFVDLRPIRIENNVPQETAVNQLQVTATPIVPSTRPTLAASPTPLSSEVIAVANLDANVREGDGVGYGRIDALFAGERARVIGISSRGTGWYYIELQDGRRGWVAPSVITITGDLSTLQRITPPPTPTPAATATFTPPPASGNLSGSLPSLKPNPPVCSEEFRVHVNITNIGTAATLASTIVLIQDIHAASGAVQKTIISELPVLNPGDNYVVGGNITVTTYYNEEHIIRAFIDPNNQVGETFENDNILEVRYTLQKGSCP